MTFKTAVIQVAWLLSVASECAPTAKPLGPSHQRPNHSPHHFPPHFPPHGGGQAISSTVDLGYARYQGTTLAAGVNQWLGIQYGAPPLGNLRWRAPQTPPVNRELQQATAFAPTCLGLFGPGLSNSTNEDCLYLDVFAPSHATTESKLPVWFFIQGGGYAGDTDQNFNFTEVVVNSNHNMVAVQINYRVGAFGFLASEDIRKDGDLNVGLLDQRKALHWVQQYIHLFGGDKDHVVIHGDSAGAGSVAHHITAYGGRDDHLFVGGMMESSFWPTQRQVSEMEFQYERFAANLSCSASEAPDGDILACLRSKDTATLQSADMTGIFPGATGLASWWFLPVVDGVFSTDYLYNLFDQGKLVRVPVVVGDDTDEGTGFSPNASSHAEFLQFLKDNFPKLTPKDLQKISAAYPEHGFGTFVDHAAWFPATEAAYGENTFICPGNEVSNAMSTFNSPNKVWNYRYNVQDPAFTSIGLGVPHVSEKPAIWGPGNSGACDGCSYETINAPIVPLLMSYWISFILTLDPNTFKSPIAPSWETWHATSSGWNGWHGWHGSSGPHGGVQSTQRLRIQLNDTGMELVPAEQTVRCELWKSLAEVTQQ